MSTTLGYVVSLLVLCVGTTSVDAALQVFPPRLQFVPSFLIILYSSEFLKNDIQLTFSPQD